MNEGQLSMVARGRVGMAALMTAFLGIACGATSFTGDTSAELRAILASSRAGTERLERKDAVSKFYEARSYRRAWDGKASDILVAIRGMEADGLDPDHYHLKAIEASVADRDTPRGADDAAALDVLLSDAVATMADDVHYGRVRPSQVNPVWNADPREGAEPLDQTLATIANSVRVSSAIAQQRPDHFIYRGLSKALERLKKVQASGGWGRVSPGKAISPGAVDARVPEVRARLAAEGYLSDAVATNPTRYDPALARAVKSFQEAHRVDPTGVIGPATIAAMNVTVQARIGQIRANLERARWVLGGLGQDFLLVNLPAFKAYLIKGDKNVWESRTQIGDEAMQTPTFRATIKTVVFNPDWSVPRSILAHEIIPAMQSGKDVVGRQHLMVYDQNNQPVDASSIDWASADSENFPYDLRQPPAKDNALGQVKFLFPNKYAIYLHDTPNQQLFAKGTRTFSHGCIRLENALDLADQLLRGQDDWGPAKIQETVADDETQNVTLEHPVPIVIVYWTVSVGASGEARYAQDIYDLDPALVGALDRSSRRN